MASKKPSQTEVEECCRAIGYDAQVGHMRDNALSWQDSHSCGDRGDTDWLDNLSPTKKHLFLLVEPIAKTPYPPVGLMKISSMLKDRFQGCTVVGQGGRVNDGLQQDPSGIFITSLFTWDWESVVDAVRSCGKAYPASKIAVGGIAASLVGMEIERATGVRTHSGLHNRAEYYSPDYSLTFGRQLRASITFTTRGCPNACKFCSVPKLEPRFLVKEDWEKDINPDLGEIVFWDNNFLASPNLVRDCERMAALGKRVDFNQGLDARRYDEDTAKVLSKVGVDPVRFAFDSLGQEASVRKAIRLAKEYTTKEICVYVLYNFEDSPEDLFYRIDLLNRERVLAFPMEYRAPTSDTRRLPNRHWNGFLLRAFKLSLLFYYRKGMITEKRESFESIYGRTAQEFVSKLYEIYQYDKKLRRQERKSGDSAGGSVDG